MSSEHEDNFWVRLTEGTDWPPSEISNSGTQREFGLEARTMQNNKPLYLVDVASELAKTMLTKGVVDGRQPSMSVASQMMTGIVVGYDAVTPMQRFQVAYSMIDVVDALVVAELSKLVMPARQSRMTWKQAADLVDLPESTLHSRYYRRVFDTRNKA